MTRDRDQLIAIHCKKRRWTSIVLDTDFHLLEAFRVGSRTRIVIRLSFQSTFFPSSCSVGVGYRLHFGCFFVFRQKIFIVPLLQQSFRCATVRRFTVRSHSFDQYIDLSFLKVSRGKERVETKSLTDDLTRSNEEFTDVLCNFCRYSFTYKRLATNKESAENEIDLLYPIVLIRDIFRVSSSLFQWHWWLFHYSSLKFDLGDNKGRDQMIVFVSTLGMFVRRRRKRVGKLSRALYMEKVMFPSSFRYDEVNK